MSILFKDSNIIHWDGDITKEIYNNFNVNNIYINKLSIIDKGITIDEALIYMYKIINGEIINEYDLFIFNNFTEELINYFKLMKLYEYGLKLNIIKYPKLILHKNKVKPCNIIYDDDNDLYVKTKFGTNRLINKIKENANKIIKQTETWIVFAQNDDDFNYIYDNLLKINNPFIKVKQIIDDNFKFDLIPNCIQILITTIIAETIKLPKVTCVFDSMCSNIQKSINKYSIEVESKNSAINRLNCLQENGTLYRMCSKKFYNSLSNIDINNLPLDHLFLEVFKYNLNPILIYRSLITFDSYTDIIKKISILKLIEINNNKKLVLTNKGNFVLSLNINIKFSSMLYDFIDNGGDLSIGIIYISILDSIGNVSFIYYPDFSDYNDYFTKKNEWFQNKFLKYSANNDLLFIFNIINDIFKECKCINNLIDLKILYKYTKLNSLNNKKIFETIKTILYLANYFNIKQFNFIDQYDIFYRIIYNTYSNSIFNRFNKYIYTDNLNKYKHIPSMCCCQPESKIFGIFIAGNDIYFSLPYIN